MAEEEKTPPHIIEHRRRVARLRDEGERASRPAPIVVPDEDEDAAPPAPPAPPRARAGR